MFELSYVNKGEDPAEKWRAEVLSQNEFFCIMHIASSFSTFLIRTIQPLIKGLEHHVGKGSLQVNLFGEGKKKPNPALLENVLYMPE